MSAKQKLAELFEKLKAHSQKSNDPELAAIVEEVQASFEPTADEDEGGGGNNPKAPDIP